MKKICLVIVTWNRLEILRDTLTRIEKQTLLPYTIIVVDNGSTDGTIDFLKTLSASSEKIQSIFLPDNPGFGAGLAAGMKKGLQIDSFDYFWLMDDDSKPESNTLEILVSNIENSPFDLLGLKGYLMKWGQPKLVRTPNILAEVDYVLVDGAIVKVDAVNEVGVIGDYFFMMCEDYEYCLRLKKHGKKIGLLNANYERLHLGSERFSKGTLWRGYYHAKNHLIILKDYPSFMRLLGYTMRQFKYLMAALLFAPDKLSRIRFRLLGIWHGLANKRGKTLDPKNL